MKRITRTISLAAAGLAVLAGTLLAADTLLDFIDRLPPPISTLAKIVFAVAFVVLIYIIAVAADRNRQL